VAAPTSASSASVPTSHLRDLGGATCLCIAEGVTAVYCLEHHLNLEANPKPL
jgi:hypothetical protein